MKNLILLIMSCVSLLACDKNKPKIGDYEANFYGSYTKNGQIITFDRYQEASIVSVNKNEISLSIYEDGTISSKLKKDGKLVNGIFEMLGDGATGGPSHPAKEIYVTGSWSKKKGKYYIKGFHQYIYTDVDVQNQKINEYVVSGDFEIKSK